jgi:hypothetical protein
MAAAIRARVLAPLGLADSFSAAGEAYPSEWLVRGYYHRPAPLTGQNALPVAQGGEMWRTGGVLGYSDELQDATALFPMSGAYAAGDMVGTPSDLVRFLTAWVTGRLLSAEVTSREASDNARQDKGARLISKASHGQCPKPASLVAGPEATRQEYPRIDLSSSATFHEAVKCDRKHDNNADDNLLNVWRNIHQHQSVD